MNGPRPPHRLTLWVRSYPTELLALLVTAFILQAGLVPFDFDFSGATARLRRPMEITSSPLTFHDVVANLFLFVPFGVLVQIWFFRWVGRGLLAFPLTLLAAGVLSGGLEWIQAYSPSRVSSLVDFVCNLGGAAVGAVVSSAARRIVPGLVGAAAFEFRAHPPSATLKTYCALLVFLAALPFTFAFDATRLKQTVRTSVFIPFGDSRDTREATEAARSTNDARASAFLKWVQMRRWSRWTAEAASFVVLAWLMQVLLRGSYGFTDRASAALTIWLAGPFAMALSLLQFLVVSRGCDVTDVLFRCGGVLIGLATWSRVRERAMSAAPAWAPVRGGAVAVAVWILFSGLAPFHFERPAGGVLAPFSSTGFLPFMAYFVTRVDLMLTDVLEKIVSYALLGGLVAAGWPRVRELPTGSKILRATTVGLVLACTIELVQVLIPVRVVSLTDPILAAVGCLIGVVLQEHVARFVDFVATGQVLDSDDRPVERLDNERLTLTDALVASLAEPHAAAPREAPPLPHEHRKN